MVRWFEKPGPSRFAFSVSVLVSAVLLSFFVIALTGQARVNIAWAESSAIAWQAFEQHCSPLNEGGEVEGR